MTKRSSTSIFIALTFLLLSFSGIWLFFTKSHSWMIFLHVLLGSLFIFGIPFHVLNNWPSLKKHLRSRPNQIVLGILFMLFALTATQQYPLDQLSQAYARFKARQPVMDQDQVTVYHFADEPNMTIEIRAAQHFWFPQIVLWAEDTSGNYLRTLFATESTAKGLFFGGRTKENFKSFDTKKSAGNHSIRRVDALPFWSHSRDAVQEDGIYAPSTSQPLPDGISGATPDASFQVKSHYPDLDRFKVFMEVNVAFDDNRYYSEFDYPDDSLYHSGTGLIGQPSVVYETSIDLKDHKRYYVMEYIGHTYPSGTSDQLFRDTEGLTTALEIIDLAFLKIH